MLSLSFYPLQSELILELRKQVEIEKTNKLLRDKEFDEPTKAGLGGGGGKKEIELENIGRYDMIRSRLW